MGANSQVPHNRAKVTIDCTVDERAYIKMLAARAHMTLSEFILSYLRKDFPEKKTNEDTLEAMNELDEGRGHRFESLDDFWEQMGMNPNAR